jgi:UDP-2-acetamido-2-deoxy-ribo-hexuluronate aminotransferase
MSDRIKLFQTERSWPEIREQVWALTEQQHLLGQAQNGTINNELESRLATKFNRKHCITTANCTDALTIALIALGLPKHSMIGVSNYTFTASAHAIARAGYTVIPIDVTDNYCVDPSKVKYLSALVTVDLFGNMSAWKELNKLNIPIVNDAAQSLESHDGVNWSAGYGKLSCISFSPSKTISSWGSGGAVLTDDDELAATCKKLRLHGKSKNDDLAIHPGLNSMLGSFEAACVIAGLDRMDLWLERRRKIAEYLIAESQYPTGLDMTLQSNTLHKLVFQSQDRESLRKKFIDAGIDCPIHYINMISDEPLYRNNCKFPVSDKLKNITFTVPNQHTLTDVEVERIAKELK